MQSLKDKASHWFVEGLEDWLYFLQGPQPQVFNNPPRFQKKRLFRLVVFAVSASILLGVIPTVSIEGVSKTPEAITATSTPAIVIMLCAGTLAGVYSVSAKIFRVPITAAQAFYIFSFLTLPWLPSTALVLSLENLLRSRVIGFLISAWLSFTILIVVVYICIGVSRVAACSKLRCWASIVLPIALVVTLIIWLIEGIDLRR
jgi:hypothetical protein